MITTIQDKLKASVRGGDWRKVRKSHLLTEAFCQCCGRIKQLEVHHIQPWAMVTELRFDPDNLITLCRECHFRFGHHSYWRDWNPHIRKNCIQFGQRDIVILKRGYHDKV